VFGSERTDAVSQKSYRISAGKWVRDYVHFFINGINFFANRFSHLFPNTCCHSFSLSRSLYKEG
jgi:hypothetical protein